MQETDCDYYFLSSTALLFWQTDNEEGQKQMLACLSSVHKRSFFNRVIFQRHNYPDSWFRELAENAFVKTWEQFNKAGKAGKKKIKEKEYTRYFFSAFKNNYLKLIEKDLRNENAEKEFGGRQTSLDDDAGQTEAERAQLSPRTLNALNRTGENCKELLWWRYVENLSHDEIARRRNMEHESSIKMVWRCKERFLQHWRGPQL